MTKVSFKIIKDKITVVLERIIAVLKSLEENSNFKTLDNYKVKVVDEDGDRDNHLFYEGDRSDYGTNHYLKKRTSIILRNNI